MFVRADWFNLADEAFEEALLHSTALRRFVGIDLEHERVPDGTTLLKFRHILEDKKLSAALFAKVGEVLQTRGLKGGTGINSTSRTDGAADLKTTGLFSVDLD